MTASSPEIHLGNALVQPAEDDVTGGFTTIDGERYARIANVDQLDPFLMNVVGDSDTWLFAGSNGPFTAGRGTPDGALFPYQTVDKILRSPTTSGAITALLVARGRRTELWEPWQDGARVYRINRNLYKRVDGTAILFEEINHDLGLRFRWLLASCERFGLVRRAELVELTGSSVEVRYLDGWHELLPPGVGQDSYVRLSYLATAYMRHERVPALPMALYTLNARISDRTEPSESLRAAVAWSVGHENPTILLSERQLAAFRQGRPLAADHEVRGEMGAYLVEDSVHLAGRAAHHWLTIADTGLDHAAILALRDTVAGNDGLEELVEAALASSRDGIRQRIGGADGFQTSDDEAATANHTANALFNLMRGGSFDSGEVVPLADLAAYLADQNPAMLDRSQPWLASLRPGIRIGELVASAEATGDPQLVRHIRTYLPLTFSRRHGDPSRPWNRFSIRVRDEGGAPVYGYEGNWRDIFQNWEALGASFPGYLAGFVDVFLNASTADGYNPYRITRKGVDWEVEDPADPWSHIGYWGDHQILYLMRLLEALDQHEPGRLAARLDEKVYGSANVPYRIATLATIMTDPRTTITFDAKRHAAIVADVPSLGADARLLRDAAGDVCLVTLAEKLLLPLLVKLTNLVPGGGIWLNTQRPEWNDANNALAGWGLSVVTLGAVYRYLNFLDRLVAPDAPIHLTAAVDQLLTEVTEILRDVRLPLDDEARYAAIERLGHAGERHRDAVYAGTPGDVGPVSGQRIRDLIAAAIPVVEGTLREGRRPDGLFHGYNVLRLGSRRASITHLGPMLEGQVAIIDSGLLTSAETADLLISLRASDMFREDQHSYMLYPDRALTPFLKRNTLAGAPPLEYAGLFVQDHIGDWHFNGDLSTMHDVDLQLERARADAATREIVRALWRSTFDHDAFTGRSGTFFMFEGLGSIFWHMVAKLLLAVGRVHAGTQDGPVRDRLAHVYDDIRDGLNLRKSPQLYGAFPSDPYSHSPRHRGAQQPGMTGQAKEQLLTRFCELGVRVVGGRLQFQPRLLHRDEFLPRGGIFSYIDADLREQHVALPPDGLGFTYCGLPVYYRLGDASSIEVVRADGVALRTEGTELDIAVSREILERRGTVVSATVTVPRDAVALPQRSARRR